MRIGHKLSMTTIDRGSKKLDKTMRQRDKAHPQVAVGGLLLVEKQEHGNGDKGMSKKDL